jgi:hypothetical protein
VADSPGRDFFISYTGVNRLWAEWIAVQLEAAGLLGRLRDGWTRPAAVLVDAAEPRQVHDRFHDGLRLRWERAGNGQQGPLDPGARRSATVGAIRRRHGKEP